MHSVQQATESLQSKWLRLMPIQSSSVSLCTTAHRSVSVTIVNCH